jgi:hypothetical protein
MGVAKKTRIFLHVLQQNGMAAVIRRIRKSQRLRWYRCRGQILNYRYGWRTKRPILVIESDDWGAEHIPGPEAIEQMKKTGLFSGDSHGMYDGLETADDVDKLCNILSSHKDGDGNPAVITANFIMANPDFSAIIESNYSIFKAKPIDVGWNHEPATKTLWQEYRAGINCGLIVPQLHGIYHFCPTEWMERLRQQDPATQHAFDLQMIGEKEDASGTGIKSMAPIYHGTTKVIKQFVADGARTFKRIFGVDSITTIAPCYAWRSWETEESLLTHNTIAMQGREYQHLPDGGIKLHYMGERGPCGMLYLVRNCTLEPISASTTVEQCVGQISLAFQHNHAAIICSHRINYTSRVTAEVRDRGLAVLDGVLKQVEKKFSNVEFLSSDKLALRILAQKHAENPA